MRLFFAASLLLVTNAFAGPGHAHDDDEGCMQGPVAQFGRYIGDWRIEDETLAQDGSGWSDGAGARWRFECVGGGVAVQDYWMPLTGGFGTNLRTFNPSTDSWEIVWTARLAPGLQRISARENENGEIVMSIDYPVPPQPQRIIFYPPKDGGWNWAMQWSLDEGKTWFDVYRIKATPWVDD